MYFIYFSWWKDFRVPTSTPKVKVATAGKACGVWYEKLNTFQFKLPAGVCAADMSFMGTSGIHEFHFTLDSAQATHVAWEHADYPHTTDAFLLERAFHQVSGKRPQVVDLPLPRVADIILEIIEFLLIEETPGLHLEIEADLSLHQNNQLLCGLVN